VPEKPLFRKEWEGGSGCGKSENLPLGVDSELSGQKQRINYFL
jgi:hypothetical protein